MPRYFAGDHEFAGRITEARHGLSAGLITALQAAAGFQT